MEITVRPATRDDVPLILSFIKGLAAYEKLADEVRADEAKLAETLFAERPCAEVLIAELGETAAGFALFFSNYSTFLAKPGIYLEDLFVNPDQRGHGVGKTLLAHLAKLAVARGCGRFEWSVLDWNEPAIGFYKSLGAVSMEGWTINRLTGEALQALALSA